MEESRKCGAVCTQEECDICNHDECGGRCICRNTDEENLKLAIEFYDQQDMPYGDYVYQALQEFAANRNK